MPVAPSPEVRERPTESNNISPAHGVTFRAVRTAGVVRVGAARHAELEGVERAPTGLSGWPRSNRYISQII